MLQVRRLTLDLFTLKMAQNFMPLFWGILGVLCQIVVPSSAGYCQDNSPAVRLCTNDTGSATEVFVGANDVPPGVNITCWCTLDTGSLNMKVTRLRQYTSDIDIFINNEKVLVSTDFKKFSHTPAMNIKFEMSDTQTKAQCYKFEKVPVPVTTTNISITCRKTVNSGTTQPEAPATTSTGAPATNTSGDTNGTQRTEPSNTNTVTAKQTSPGTKETGTSKNTNGIDIGVIAGAAGGGLAVVVVVIIITVVICKRRGGSEKDRKQDAPDKHYEEPEYSLTTNAGYVSADDCHRETDNATGHDPRGYTLVNKPRPKQQDTQQNAVDEDNYNHLNDVLHTHNPANVYNTRAEATAEPDRDDYNRLNEFRKPNETDNVYNVASSSTNPSNEYDRTNVPTRNGPADYEYSTTNKVYKP